LRRRVLMASESHVGFAAFGRRKPSEPRSALDVDGEQVDRAIIESRALVTYCRNDVAGLAEVASAINRVRILDFLGCRAPLFRDVNCRRSAQLDRAASVYPLRLGGWYGKFTTSAEVRNWIRKSFTWPPFQTRVTM
jgi:hypothetical protein